MDLKNGSNSYLLDKDTPFAVNYQFSCQKNLILLEQLGKVLANMLMFKTKVGGVARVR
jgi:hypothetical protein